MTVSTGLSITEVLPGALTHLMGLGEEAPGARAARLQTIVEFAQQLVGDGPLADALADIAAKILVLQTATGTGGGLQFAQRLTDIENELLAAAASYGTLTQRLAIMQKATDITSQYRPVEREFRTQAAFQKLQKTLVVALPKVLAAEYGGDVTIPAQVITFDVPTSVRVTERRTVSYPGLYNGAVDLSGFPGQRLTYQYTSDAVGRRVDTSAVVTRGIDWDISPNTGLPYSLIQGPAFQIDITYTGWCHRYDVLWGPAGGNSAGYGLVKGTDRAIDPEEYLPSPPVGERAIFRVYIYADPTGQPRAELIPVHRYRGRVLIARPNEYLDHLERNRAFLARVFARLNRGLPLKIILYGDSIQGMGGGFGANQTVWGADRDILKGGGGYFQANDLPLNYGRMPDDTAATVPRFDGPLGVGMHQHLGYVWYLKAAIEARYGVKVEVHNWGVGGSDSSNTMVNGTMNGLYPDRLNAVLADAKDALVIFGFGMNEIGKTTTFANLAGMYGYFKAAGMAGAIFMGVPQVSYPGRLDSFSQTGLVNGGWYGTHQQILKAADATNSAYIDMLRLDGQFPAAIDLGTPPKTTNYPAEPQYLTTINQDLFHHGCTGLSWMNLCNTNLFNHPGREQLKHIGLALSDIFYGNPYSADPTAIAPSFGQVDATAGTYSITLPDGMILKGGSIPAGGSADGPVTFAIAFPTRCFDVEVIEEPTEYGTGTIYKAYAVFKSPTGFTFIRRSFAAGSSNGATATFPCRFVARGI